MAEEREDSKPKRPFRRRRRPPQGVQETDSSRQPQQPADQRTPAVSVVIPLYNEEGSITELNNELRSVLGGMGVPYEIVFVDDGSTDKSFQILREIYRSNKRIKIVRFRRNFGKSAALAMGFKRAQGSIIITMDGDLQDDPTEIPHLVREIKKGFDVISGWKRKRKDPLAKIIPSKLFNTVVRVVTGIRIHDFNCGLKAYRAEAAKNLKVYGELHRFLPVLAHWQGFRVGEKTVNHRPRKFGRTKFGIGRFFKGFLDFLTVLFTTRYAARPLHLFGTIGLLSLLTGFVIDAYLTVRWFLGQITLSNRPLLLAGFLLIIVGVQFIAIGLLGEMITRSHNIEDDYSVREILE